MPSGPSSAARSTFHVATAALAAPYAPAPLSAAIDPMVMTAPPLGIRSRTAAVVNTAEIRLESRLARHPAARDSRSDGASRSKSVLPPAQCTTTSMVPGSESCSRFRSFGSELSQVKA